MTFRRNRNPTPDPTPRNIFQARYHLRRSLTQGGHPDSRFRGNRSGPDPKLSVHILRNKASQGIARVHTS